METSASLMINATKEKVWAVVTDIENAKERISCIKDIKVLEKPKSGFVGFKWKETRVMFGKEAVETMWIKESKENDYYITEAVNSGCVYHSTVALAEAPGGTMLTMSFKSTPQSLSAKLMSPVMYLMKGVIKKAFLKDLEDISRIFPKL